MKDLSLLFIAQVSVLIELGLETLHFLEKVNEDAARRVAPKLRNIGRVVCEPLLFHKVPEIFHSAF